MKFTTFAAALAVSTIAGSAFAADLPSRKQAPVYVAPAPIMTWGGFYVGLNFGGAFSGSKNIGVSTAPGFIDTNNLSATGVLHALDYAVGANGSAAGRDGSRFIGGGQIGYNWQSGSFVAGLEADIQGFIGSGNNRGGFSTLVSIGGETPVATSVAAHSRVDWLGTLRGRLGFTATPSFLLYATGGLAYGGVKSSTSIFGAEVVPSGLDSAFTAGSFSGTRVGWTVGAGAEWMFARNWSAKLEYLYYDLGSKTYALAPYVGANRTGAIRFVHTSATRVKYSGHIVRAGVNYHFNWGAPAAVVAKY